MTNYFELYKTILSTVKSHNPDGAQELFDLLSQTDYVKSERKAGNESLASDTLMTLDNLIDDGLIKGKKLGSKTGSLYMLSGLTTAGFAYLEQTSSEGFKQKLIAFLKDEGLPMTPTAITKFITRTLL